MWYPTLLSTLSWAGFMGAAFVQWAAGNTNGGYYMAGIATILPFVVAVTLLAVNAHKFTPLIQVVPLLLTLSWIGFIVSGFMRWYTGDRYVGYIIVVIVTILLALNARIDVDIVDSKNHQEIGASLNLILE